MTDKQTAMMLRLIKDRLVDAHESILKKTKMKVDEFNDLMTPLVDEMEFIDTLILNLEES